MQGQQQQMPRPQIKQMMPRPQMQGQQQSQGQQHVAVKEIAGTASPLTHQQKLQFVQCVDGKLQVRGLHPGQELVQLPDGKLQVLASQGNAASPLGSGAQLLAQGTGGAVPLPQEWSRSWTYPQGTKPSPQGTKPSPQGIKPSPQGTTPSTQANILK